jgi:hypothetical protein
MQLSVSGSFEEDHAPKRGITAAGVPKRRYANEDYVLENDFQHGVHGHACFDSHAELGVCEGPGLLKRQLKRQNYGFYSTGTFDGTPRVTLGRETYDGNGSYTNTITINNNGTLIHLNDFGTYTVNADCTGTIFNTASGATFQFVLVDGGKEIYRLTFNGGVSYTVNKKQFPDE